MIRASSAGKITTNRPFFDSKAFGKLNAEFKDKVEKKKLVFKDGEVFALEMLITPGLKTIAEKIIKGYGDHQSALIDPLPPGAKTYLQELYLETNYGFYNMSMSENDPALKKGTLVEDGSIALLGEHLSLELFNNKDRESNPAGFLTGEADILYANVVRDIKSPLNWSTFRKKDGIESIYHWQLVAYCLLYGKDVAYLDYVLMPMPEEMIKDQIRNMSAVGAQKFIDYNAKIGAMPSKERIKTYEIAPAQIKKDIEFLKKRLVKAKAYYETLNYDICMKMN